MGRCKGVNKFIRRKRIRHPLMLLNQSSYNLAAVSTDKKSY
jgi:hypothetical protein